MFSAHLGHLHKIIIKLKGLIHPSGKIPVATAVPFEPLAPCPGCRARNAVKVEAAPAGPATLSSSSSGSSQQPPRVSLLDGDRVSGPAMTK